MYEIKLGIHTLAITDQCLLDSAVVFMLYLACKTCTWFNWRYTDQKKLAKATVTVLMD